MADDRVCAHEHKHHNRVIVHMIHASPYNSPSLHCRIQHSSSFFPIHPFMVCVYVSCTIKVAATSPHTKAKSWLSAKQASSIVKVVNDLRDGMWGDETKPRAE